MISLPDATLASRYVIKTHYIMRVLKFDPETQTVDLIQDVFEFTNTPMGQYTVINEFGNEVTVALQKPDILYGVPVKVLRWGQFEIQACPAPGDTGYIEVFTNDILDWIQNGSRSIPFSDSHFLKSSCVFVPFVPNHKNAATDYPAKPDGSADNTKMIIKSANARIVFEDALSVPDGPTNTTVTIGTKNGSVELKDIDSGTGTPLVTLTAQADQINLIAPKGVTVTGNLTVTGGVIAGGTMTATGNMIGNADITTTGTITAKEVRAPTIGEGTTNLVGHVHTSSTPGNPTGPATAPKTGE